MANTSSGKVEGYRTTQAAQADNQYPGIEQLLLPLLTYILHQQVAAVAHKLIMAQGLFF